MTTLCTLDVFSLVHVGECFEDIRSVRWVLEETEHLLTIQNADTSAVSQLIHRIVVLALFFNTFQEFVFEVFDEKELDFETPKIFVFFPPESKWIVYLKVTDHLGHSAELSTLYHWEKQIDLLALPGSLLESLRQNLVILHWTRPDAIFYGFMNVIIVSTPYNKKSSISYLL